MNYALSGILLFTVLWINFGNFEILNKLRFNIGVYSQSLRKNV